VIVTRGEAPAALLERFARHEPAAVEEVRTHADRGFTLLVHLAHEFRGYRD